MLRVSFRVSTKQPRERFVSRFYKTTLRTSRFDARQRREHRVSTKQPRERFVSTRDRDASIASLQNNLANVSFRRETETRASRLYKITLRTSRFDAMPRISFRVYTKQPRERLVTI